MRCRGEAYRGFVAVPSRRLLPLSRGRFQMEDVVKRISDFFLNKGHMTGVIVVFERRAAKDDVPLLIRQFAEGLKADMAAVTPSLTLPRNNTSSA